MNKNDTVDAMDAKWNFSLDNVLCLFYRECDSRKEQYLSIQISFARKSKTSFCSLFVGFGHIWTFIVDNQAKATFGFYLLIFWCESKAINGSNLALPIIRIKYFCHFIDPRSSLEVAIKQFSEKPFFVSKWA